MFNAISPTTNIYMYMYITETLNWYCNYLFFLNKGFNEVLGPYNCGVLPKNTSKI